MANISDVQGNISWIKSSYKQLLGPGEGVVGDEFIMTFEGNANVRYLVQTSQMPPLGRENIESYGPQGVQFRQQGRYKNAQDIPISFKETIHGYAYEFLRDLVKNKKYITVNLQLAGESYTGGNTSGTLRLEDCWIEIDGADLSVEDGTSLVRPSGTLHANWVSWCDDDTSTIINTLLG